MTVSERAAPATELPFAVHLVVHVDDFHTNERQTFATLQAVVEAVDKIRGRWTQSSTSYRDGIRVKLDTHTDGTLIVRVEG